ncbi:homeobox and leucine zipper encoding b [Trichomycterus rosablanca]|uniref:homeobox and leucine zipper encoding b n=1 Tax=Trichomycterus rosablanca TaxID=2290929 RepID=UPI002F35D4E7
MEQLEPPRCDKPSAAALHCEENQKSEARKGTKTGARVKVGNNEANDAYECRICGYRAEDVLSFSQHLHSVHPVTGLSGPKPQRNEKCRGADEKERLAASPLGDQISEGRKSPTSGNFSEESMSSSPMDSEETSTITSNLENQVPAVKQKETVKPPPAAKISQSTPSASILPRRKASSSSDSSKENQSEDAASSGTSSLNQTHLVCLPLVSDGLKLVWVRSEQIHELDAVSELVEVFNDFPYPTEQEIGALARRCSLSQERVKVWFMMQRVRYGISWAEDDIRQTRLKLYRLQGMPIGEECREEEEEDGKGEEDGFLAHQERTSDTLQPVSVMDTYLSQAYYTPRPGFFQDEVNNYSIIPQYTNGFEQFQHQTDSTAQYMGDFEIASLDKGSAHLFPSHESKPDILNIRESPKKSAEGRRGPTIMQRKKSKDQLMVLRRSFVRTNWPTEAEVQRLQRVTGLGRHEIRKWFADSRYQLRRGTRSWVTEMTRQTQSPSESDPRRLNDDDFPEDDEPTGSGEGLDYELDVDMNDEQAPLEDDITESDPSKAQEMKEPERRDSPAPLKRDRKESVVVPSPSPASSSPSTSIFKGYVPAVGPEPNLRKKTWEQLNMLRQSFLHCPWPTSDDYTYLQQKTGLTRTEIVQWYGDTRYHLKHSNLRWIRPEDKDRVRAAVMKQQKRAGRGPRNRGWLDVKDTSYSLGSQASNGTVPAETRTWEELYKTTSSVLPGGEL